MGGWSPIAGPTTNTKMGLGSNKTDLGSARVFISSNKVGLGSNKMTTRMLKQRMVKKINSRSDLFAYRDQMRRQHNEYKMNTLNLLAKLYQTVEELEKTKATSDSNLAFINHQLSLLKERMIQ